MNCQTCNAPNEAGATSCSVCGSVLEPQDTAPGHHLPPGTPLHGGDFTITSTLGAGGFGITYQADDNRLGRTVAIKEFFPPYCARVERTVQPGSHLQPQHYEDARAGFLQEATTLARFRHPCIVAVFSVFEENNTAYMVMEYLQGRNLLQLLHQQDGRLAENDAVEIMRQVAAALSQVHEAGLLHRDIKPDNILLAGEDRVVLIDFGTAREFDIEHTGNQSRVVTPGYAPLEQYAPRARRGPFSDIYALAATLYHLVTGQPPASATDRASGVALIPPSQLNAAISAGLNDAIMGALEVGVDKRPQTVAEFLSIVNEALRNPAPAGTPALHSSAVTPRPLVTVSESSLPGESHERRNRFSRSMVAGIVLVLALGTLGFLWAFSGRLSGGANDAALPQFRTIELTPADRMSRDENKTVTTMPRHQGASFSSDGKYLAAEDEKSGAIVIWDTQSGAKRSFTTADRNGIGLLCSSFSPDGAVLATVRSPAAHERRELLQYSDNAEKQTSDYATEDSEIKVQLWDVATGRNLRTLPPGKSFATSLAFSPDGTRLAVATRSKKTLIETATVYETASGSSLGAYQGAVSAPTVDPQTVFNLTAGYEHIYNFVPSASIVRPPAVAFGHDGKVLVHGDGTGVVRCWDVASGKEVRRLSGFKDCVTDLAVSKDGKILLVAAVTWAGPEQAYSRYVVVVDLQSGKKEWRTLGAGPLVVAPDGKSFAFMDLDYQGAKVLDVKGERSLGAFIVPNAVTQSNFTTISFTQAPGRLRLTGPTTDLYSWSLE